ncbi:MAG: glycogen/starch/alpha-glucan phosphorylase [Christensenellales bacterium]
MIEARALLALAGEKASLLYHLPLERLTWWQLHEVLGGALMAAITPDWRRSLARAAEGRQAYYLSAEYLLGRLVFNDLYAAGVLEEVRTLLAGQGIDLHSLEEVEDDAFGNGGLGRLAACYLDSAATHDIPLFGYGLRYRFGLFRQSFFEGCQVESPDDWSRYGDPWSLRRRDLAVKVSFGDGEVLAVPYDLPVLGYQLRSVGTLRLWQCESLEEVDFGLFNRQDYQGASAEKNKAEDITKFLYPNDSTDAGRALRIKAEYLLASATMQDLLTAFKGRIGCDLEQFARYHAIQLNDTHPVMAIPELVRLLQREGLSFPRAFDIARETFSYTNHTVMAEALETWNGELLRKVLPALYPVICQINTHLLREHKDQRLSCLRGGAVHMATLAVCASHKVNGVAEIHSAILRDKVFKDACRAYPERFTNVTNGITQRRWLGLCNPQLTGLLQETLGDAAFLTQLDRLSALKPCINEDLCRRFMVVKREKKAELALEIFIREGIQVPVHFLFDVQVKRLHEYKRQLLNAFSILAIYRGLKAGTLPDFTPTAFIFGAKAAPGYREAKAIICYINRIAELVNRDKEVQDRLKVVFVHNYNCSYAEYIIPAADVSEQISPAGTEASGTGNMKLMLNGAVTLGTLDGANIEIVREAGPENNYIFGAGVEEIDALRDSYDPQGFYQADPALHAAVDSLIDGTFRDPDGELAFLHGTLLRGASWHRPDHQFLFLDFDSYMKAKLRANLDYRDGIGFARKCLLNIAGAGKFSSDRSILEYARQIWRL